MSAPEPAALPTPVFNLERAIALFDRVTQNDHEIALPLFLLLRGLVDPDGDPDRFAIADEVMRRAILMTPQFEEWYRSLVA